VEDSQGEVNLVAADQSLASQSRSPIHQQSQKANPRNRASLEKLAYRVPIPSLLGSGKAQTGHRGTNDKHEAGKGPLL
jgi:hypothetical protein